MKLARILNLLLIITAVPLTSKVYAQETGSICAAVYTCGNQGEVLSPFNQGECAPYYSAICEKEYEEDLKENLNICNSTNEELILQIKYLQKKIKKMSMRARARRAR